MTEIPTLTFEAVRETAKRVAYRHGTSFRYSNGGQVCYYVPSSHPEYPGLDVLATALAAEFTGCLVGEILKELGALTPEVARSTQSVTGLHESGEISAEPFVVEYLGTIQAAQDGGLTWPEAYQLAEYEHRRKNENILKF